MDLDTLKKQREALEEQVLDVVSHILDELEARLYEFAQVVAEKIFKGHPRVSSQFDQVALSHFKQEIHDTTEKTIAEMLGTLADESLWLTVRSHPIGKDSLTENLKVWPVIKKFSLSLTPVLQKYGYPSRMGTLQAVYPETEFQDISDFPKPDQLRLLCLKYWFYISKYSQVMLEMRKLKKKQKEEALHKIWQSTE